jgi:predicted amidohydrolase
MLFFCGATKQRRAQQIRLLLSGFSPSSGAMHMSTAFTSGSKHRIAVAQLRSTSDKFSNLLDVARCAGWAKRDGAAMLFLPECCCFLGESASQTLEEADPPIQDADSGPRNSYTLVSAIKSAVRLAYESKKEDIDDKTIVGTTEQVLILDGLRNIARESGLWISAGGIHVSGAPPHDTADPDHSRVYNTHLIIDCVGTVKCLYRKIHLFDVEIPGQVSLRESATTAPGKALKVCDSPIGCLGVTICYDLRFPEMYVKLTTQGAQILLVPSAFTIPTGTAHWHTLLRARAIENQCFVIAAAQFGEHNHKRESYGHALIVDPWGEVLADAGGADGGGTVSIDASNLVTPSIMVQEIDLDLVTSARQRIPIQNHRRAAEF